MSENITRQRIANVLKKLGFVEGLSGNLTVFRNPEKDATIIVPEEFLGAYGDTIFLNAAKETVIGNGIGTAELFEKLLFNNSLRKSRTSSSASSGNHAANPYGFRHRSRSGIYGKLKTNATGLSIEKKPTQRTGTPRLRSKT